MSNLYVSSVGWSAVTAWATGVTLAVGAIRRPTAPTVFNQLCYRVSAITTGITAGTEPTWPTGSNGTVVDGGVTWTECTGQEAYQAAGNWTAPYGSLSTVCNFNQRGNANGTDTVFVANNHSETFAAFVQWSGGGRMISTQVVGSTLPPGAESYSPGATVSVTGANDYNFHSTLFWIGFVFNIGSGATQSNFTFGRNGAGCQQTFKNCALVFGNTNASSRLVLGQGISGGSAHLINTTITFGHASQAINWSVLGSTFSWRNTANAVQGVIPTALFVATAPMFVAFLENLDLSAVSGTLFSNTGSVAVALLANIRARYCKLNAAVTKITYPYLRGRGSIAEFDGCGATNTPPAAMYHGRVRGIVQTSFTIARAGGAQLNAAKFSWEIQPASTANGAPTTAWHPDTPWILASNALTGSARTLTIYGIANKAAMPNSNMLWVEAAYLGSASNPLWYFSAPLGPVGLPAVAPTTAAADTSDWGSVATARVNGASYAVNDAIGVSSNATRVFFCTTAGTASGSLPAGYATAVDGGSVTDGTAVFRAGWRLSLNVSVTPQQAGTIGLRVHLVDSQSVVTSVFVDPSVVVT